MVDYEKQADPNRPRETKEIELMSNLKNLKYIKLDKDYIIFSDAYNICLAKLKKIKTGKEQGKYTIVEKSYHKNLLGVLTTLEKDISVTILPNYIKLDEYIDKLTDIIIEFRDSLKNISIDDLKGEKKNESND